MIEPLAYLAGILVSIGVLFAMTVLTPSNKQTKGNMVIVTVVALCIGAASVVTITLLT